VPRLAPGRHRPEHRGIERLDAVQRDGDALDQADRLTVGLLDHHPSELPAVSRRPLASTVVFPYPAGAASRTSDTVLPDCRRR